MESPRQHASPPNLARAPVPQPTLAERGRTLVHTCRLGILSTHSRKQPGYPFGSVMPYAGDGHGRPVFLVSSMAMHTQNLRADARASLLISAETGGDPLGSARITLLGEVAPVPEAEAADVRELYLSRHPNARSWADFNDFAYHRLEPGDIYFIGGFGVMGWVRADEYARSHPDPLAEFSAEILEHMNADRAQALVLLAGAAGETDVSAATMTAVDRLGFHLRLRSGERVYGVRIAFPHPISDSQEVPTVLDEMVRASKTTG